MPQARSSTRSKRKDEDADEAQVTQSEEEQDEEQVEEPDDEAGEDTEQEPEEPDTDDAGEPDGGEDESPGGDDAPGGGRGGKPASGLKLDITENFVNIKLPRDGNEAKALDQIANMLDDGE